MTPREVIQSIREKYFLDTTDQKAEEFQDTFERVLKVLSAELYTKENHFVLELLQNADDNTYLEDVQPTIQLKYDEGMETIEISNNEIGFTEENVRALCDIGNSTKKARREGYIGEKGIGFKSVFKVADRVYIASNGYSFVLDSTDRLGMIAPQWVPEDEFPVSPGNGRTVFYLKLKPDINKEDLKKQFDKIHPFLLLFLRKIKKLELDVANNSRQFEKTDETENGILYVNIKQSDHKQTVTQHQFLVYEQQLTKPSEVVDAKRSEVTQTKIVIAFPLSTTTNENDRKNRMRNQNIFAFLPLRTRRFKFIIQADFLVTASREEVIEDNSWNHFLRDAIPDVFIAAVNQLKNSKQDPVRQTALISYLPLPTDNQSEFFQPVVTKILERIRSEEIILTCDMTWSIPAKAIYLPKSFTRTTPGEMAGRPLIPNDNLKAILNMDYIHELYNWDKYEPILKELLCKPFSFANLVACLKVYNGSAPAIDILWHRDVVDCLATHYRERREASAEHISTATLKQLKIYVIEDGLDIERTDLSDGRVFFFPPEGQLPTIPDRSMVILHPESLQSISHAFLADLGVKELRVSVMAELVISLYSLRGQIALQRKRKDLFAHVDFLRRHLHDLTDNFRIRLRKDILLRTKDGAYKSPDQIYIHTESPSYDINAIFSSSSISPIDDQYFSSAEGDVDMKQHWMTFLETHCGVHRAVPLQDGGALPEWLVTQIKVQKNGRFGGNILAMFAEFWPKVYEPIYQLQQRKFCDQLGDMFVRCEGGKVLNLRLTALRTPDLEGLFGDDRDYLELKGEESDGTGLNKWMFLNYFGVSVVADVQEALKVLERMSQRKQRNKEPAEIVYKFLDVNFHKAPAKIKQSFTERPLVIVKDDKNGTVDWRNSTQILWGGDRRLYPTWSFLEDSLPECRSFFVKKVGMKSATINDLWKMVQKLDAKDSKSSDHMAYVYVQLAEWLQDEENSDYDWLTELCKKPILLVKHGPKGRSFFEKNRSNITIVIDDDDRRLAELFNDLYILNVPRNMIPGMEAFLEFLDPPVWWMSETKPKAIIPSEDFTEDAIWTERVRRCIPLCARIIAHRDEVKMNQLVENGLFRIAYKLTVLRANQIHEVYEIKGVEKKRETKLTVELAKKGSPRIKIWMAKAYFNDIAKSLLVEPICSIFDSDSKELKEVLHILLDIKTPQNRINGHIEERGIPELPPKYDNIFDEQSSRHENPTPESNSIQEGSPIGESSWIQEGSPIGESSWIQEGSPIGESNWIQEDGPIGESSWIQGNSSLNDRWVHPVGVEWVSEAQQAMEPVHEPYTRNPQLRSGNMGYSAPVLFENYPPGIGVTAPNIGPSRYDAPNPVISAPVLGSDVPSSLRDIVPTRNISYGNRMTEAIPTFTQADDLQSPPDSSSYSPQQDPGLLRPRDEQDVQEVGYLGERFVFEQFCNIDQLPGFGLANWISQMRQRYLDESSLHVVGELDFILDDPEMECDFVYNDVEGYLSRKLNLPVATIPRIFYLEVKTTTSKGSESFPFTVRELESARRTSWLGREDDEGATSRVYVILRVEHVRSMTRRIVKELVDPWKKYKGGELILSVGEWTVSRFM